MRSAVATRLGAEFPIFGFSHCRDVVEAVSKAGGVGVLGAARHTLDQLATDLNYLDRSLRDRPYGVDLVFSDNEGPSRVPQLEKQIPAAHLEFVHQLATELGIDQPRAAERRIHNAGVRMSGEYALEQWQIVIQHNPQLIASALGPTPKEVARAARSSGMIVAGIAGTPRHALKHLESGADLIIAQGAEAGGHTGEISTMVLLPSVIKVASPTPVVAAGGIATGQQLAAALMLGAQGVWLGSIWLPTVESDLHISLKRRLLAAQVSDTVRSTSISGRPSRVLRNRWTDAWSAPNAPTSLPPPLQSLLVSDSLNNAVDHDVPDAMTTPVGQVVGQLDRPLAVSDVMFRLLDEFATAATKFAAHYVGDGPMDASGDG